MSDVPKEDRTNPDFTPDEDRLHDEATRQIASGLERGLSFDEACALIEVDDPEFRNVIVDDYLKVTIAERHFQGGQSLEEVADHLRIPVERAAQAKESMLKEVEEAAIAAYHRSQGKPVN